MSREALILWHIENIERELAEIKKLISSDRGKNKSLRGIWQGVDISDDEIEEAKHSLAKDIDESP